MRLTFALIAALAAPPALAEGPDGATLYTENCAVCHGASGNGNGPFEMFLIEKPADLTALAAQNGGAFPFDHVYRIIDGRADYAAHGPRSMPIWGTDFKLDAQLQTYAERDGQDAETIVTQRILALIDHLRGMQGD